MSKMISITDDGMFMASDNISAPEFLNIVMNAQMNFFTNLVSQGCPKEELYDLANQAASAFLEAFAPEIELRPDLTAEAILAKENELIMEQVGKSDPLKASMDNLAANLRKELVLDGLIPLDSLDEHGRPKTPVHKSNNVVEFKPKQ